MLLFGEDNKSQKKELTVACGPIGRLQTHEERVEASYTEATEARSGSGKNLGGPLTTTLRTWNISAFLAL